jgi:hypothetical protein
VARTAEIIDIAWMKKDIFLSFFLWIFDLTVPFMPLPHVISMPVGVLHAEAEQSLVNSQETKIKRNKKVELEKWMERIDSYQGPQPDTEGKKENPENKPPCPVSHAYIAGARHVALHD